MTGLPQPLTPVDCNLKDFQFIPVDVDRLLKSETWVLGTGDERSAAIALWLVSWQEVPAASLPIDDRMLAHLSQARNWKKVKAHALRGWIEANDGRLYHPVVAEKALEAWIEKLANSISGASGNAKRWGVDVDVAPLREKFVLAVNMLMAVAPASKALKKKVVVTIMAGSRGESPPESPPDDDLLSPPESSGDRNRQGQGQGQGLLTPKPDTPPPASTEVGSTQAEGVVSSRMGEICIFLRTFGINTSPNVLATHDWAKHPDATNDLLTAAVATAKAAKPNQPIHVNYLKPIIERLLNPPPAPKAKTDDWAWKRSNQGIEGKGRELGMFARGGESYPDFAARIQAAIDQRKGAKP